MGKPTLAFAPLDNTALAEGLAGFVPARTFDPEATASPTPATSVAEDDATPAPSSDTPPEGVATESHDASVATEVTAPPAGQYVPPEMEGLPSPDVPVRTPKVHLAKGPVRPAKQPVAEPVAPLAQGQQVRQQDDRRSPRSQASRALVVSSEKTDRRAEPQVAPAQRWQEVALDDFMRFSDKVLLALISDIREGGSRPVLRLDAVLHDVPNHLDVGLSVLPGPRVQMFVLGGEGFFGALFPERTILFRDEVFEHVEPPPGRYAPTEGMRGVLKIVTSLRCAQASR